jgi:hypothetical protein
MAYEMSREATLQRQSAALKHGNRSAIIKKLSSCFNCQFRAYCDDYLTKDEKQRRKGCSLVRNAYVSILKQTTQPELMIAKTLAEIEVELSFRQIMDGKDQEGFSKDRMKLFTLKRDFLKLQMGYKDMKAKYTVGTKQDVTVTHKMEENEVIDIPPQKEEKDGVHKDT